MTRACLTLALLFTLAAAPAAAELRAGEGVYEESHRIHVTLYPGLAVIDTRLAFRSIRAETSEISYAWRGAGALASLRVCIESRCRDSVPDRSTERLIAYELDLVAPRSTSGPTVPVAHVGYVETFNGWRARGVLRAAPVSSSHPIDVTVRAIVATELHGGRVWLRLPVTGLNTETEVTVAAPGFEEPRIDGHEGPAQLAPGHVALVTAVMPSDQPRTELAWRAACGANACTRSWVAAPHQEVPRDIVLAIDASDSMHDIPSGRVQRTVQGILDASPGSSFRVVAFGRSAEVRIADARPPGRVNAEEASRGGLGNLTRPDLVWPLVQQWVQSSAAPLVIFVSDRHIGAITPPFAVEVSLVDISPSERGMYAAPHVPPSTTGPIAASGGIVIRLGDELAGDMHAPIEHHLMQLTAAITIPDVRRPGGDPSPLRAGEVAEHAGLGLRTVGGGGLALHPRGAPSELAEVLSTWLSVHLRQPHQRELTAVDRRDFAAARSWAVGGRRHYPRVPGAVQVDHRVSVFPLAGPCDPDTFRGSLTICGQRRARVPTLHSGGLALVRGSLSREAIQLMMRGARAAVRGCFRTARRGRRDWDASFQYRIVLGHREVLGAVVSRASPSVDAELTRCLLDRPIRSLAIPHSDFVTAINYPFHAQSQAPEASIELHDEIGSLLDDIGAVESEPRQLPNRPSR